MTPNRGGGLPPAGAKKRSTFVRPGILARYVDAQKTVGTAGVGAKRAAADAASHVESGVAGSVTAAVWAAHRSVAGGLLPRELAPLLAQRSWLLARLAARLSEPCTPRATTLGGLGLPPGQGQASGLLALPNELLIRVLCFLKHSELRPLFATCARLREAAAASMAFHFNYLTPDPMGHLRALALMRLGQGGDESEEEDVDENQAGPSNRAPPAVRAMRRRRRLTGFMAEARGSRGAGGPAGFADAHRLSFSQAAAAGAPGDSHEGGAPGGSSQGLPRVASCGDLHTEFDAVATAGLHPLPEGAELPPLPTEAATRINDGGGGAAEKAGGGLGETVDSEV